MIRAAERWRAVKITDFERRQMAAVRSELDQEYEAHIGLAKPTSEEKHSVILSSSSRTLPIQTTSITRVANEQRLRCLVAAKRRQPAGPFRHKSQVGLFVNEQCCPTRHWLGRSGIWSSWRFASEVECGARRPCAGTFCKQ
jgi:hypothetical protein